MIKVSDDIILDQAKAFFQAYKDAASVKKEEEFVRKSFPTLAKEAEAERWAMLKKELAFQQKLTTVLLQDMNSHPERFDDALIKSTERRLERVNADFESIQSSLYPYNVYIPKSFIEMKQGDFEPAKVITVKEPIMCDWGPMWFGCTKDGVKLRYGYERGDSRYVSKFALDDVTPHGIMAGTTGSGKSVALNTVIYGACFEYAPWELEFTLSDAKIVEFKSLAMNNPMPQITTVAATTDADYLASVVMYKEREMKDLNSVFTVAGNVFGSEVKNIMDFRKTTGLYLPRNVIVFDEFQAMFAGAGKQLTPLVKSIDSYARLGRNTGYHLYLTSQEIGSDIPEGTLNNISLRCALGCDPSVSEKIIGNDAARVNKGTKGKLIVNIEAQNKNKKDNVPIIIPWCTPENANFMAQQAIAKGKEFDVTPVLRFYDEQDVLFEHKYDKFIHSFKKDSYRIILGEPSYMMNSDEQCVDIKLKGESNENILVVSSVINNLLRHFIALRHNLDYPKIQNFVMCADNVFVTNADAKSLCQNNPTFFYDDASYDSQFFEIGHSMTYRRKLCIETDKKVFADPTSTDESNAKFAQIFVDTPDLNTPTNKSRFYHMLGLLQTSPIFRKAFGLDGSKKDDAIILKTCKTCIKMFTAYGAAARQITYQDLPETFMWVLGLNKVMGIGRDPNTKKIETFKQTLQECAQVNIRYLIFTTNLEESNAIRSGIKWYILDVPNRSDVNMLKCQDDFPESVSGVLAVLIDADDKTRPMKFKKLFFNDETPPS